MDRARGARIAVVVLFLALAACSSSKPAARPTTTSAAPAVTTAPSTPVTAAGCAHAPSFHKINQYYGTPAPGPSINYSMARVQEPVNDRRGDTIVGVDRTLEVRRPDGTVVLVPHDENGIVALYGYGDFDGDGRTDLLVVVGDDLDHETTWIVRGTIGPGRYRPEAIGVALPKPNAIPGHNFAVVGDQNHDGGDDLSFDRALYSGRALTAADRGAALPAPFRRLPAIPIGLLSIGSGAPTFVLPDPAHDSLDLLDARHDRLRVDPIGDVPQPQRLADGELEGWSAGGHTIVGVQFGNRSGDTEWRWNLDGPCS